MTVVAQKVEDELGMQTEIVEFLSDPNNFVPLSVRKNHPCNLRRGGKGQAPGGGWLQQIETGTLDRHFEGR